MGILNVKCFENGAKICFFQLELQKGAIKIEDKNA